MRVVYKEIISSKFGTLLEGRTKIDGTVYKTIGEDKERIRKSFKGLEKAKRFNYGL